MVQYTADFILAKVYTISFFSEDRRKDRNQYDTGLEIWNITQGGVDPLPSVSPSDADSTLGHEKKKKKKCNKSFEFEGHCQATDEKTSTYSKFVFKKLLKLMMS